ncbi:MAG: sn-glycerol-3-phosphate ABC transporter ATP-binding protein UgpC [Candidatus Latescibacteria bacterium]|nr:sn-glycerol-3-phosphate ABC transporter ATP-binding protein UgpC [Candidatus Latescibacterota bacterium]
MSDLVFTHVRKEFDGGVVAVEDFSLVVPNPRMVVLVGPSGCGKTTLLRMIAGLETLTSGSIHLGEVRLDTIAPRDRDIAMVFQSYALYPHMTVAENLGFGLRIRKTSRAEIDRRVSEAARTLELDSLLARKPAQLSGGQRQRVALGRAIVREPRVFLYDEPLSNLDARLRTDMRATIRRLYDRLRTTSIYVTHDQVEAMTIGDVLVVMNKGRVHQVGSPEACYREPADTFVASFLGSPAMNFADGRIDGDAVVIDGGTRLGLPRAVALAASSRPGVEVRVGVRPEDLRPGSGEVANAAPLSGTVALREPLGHETLTHLRVGGADWVARGTREFSQDPAGRTPVFLDLDRMHIFWKDSGRRVGSAGEPATARGSTEAPA